MLNYLTPQKALSTILIVATATIAGAWIFQFAGFDPCHLCLLQRWAYYAVIPLSLVVLLLPDTFAKPGLYLLALILAGSAIFGAYHAGVEWKFWPGPGTCSGDVSGGLPDLTKTVVACDEAALRIFGISLAGWNAVISIVLAAIAFTGARNQGSSSVSQ
jgi:disulfide bond formation protein DsbB